jgi:hypothetical protein
MSRGLDTAKRDTRSVTFGRPRTSCRAWEVRGRCMVAWREKGAALKHQRRVRKPYRRPRRSMFKSHEMDLTHGECGSHNCGGGVTPRLLVQATVRWFFVGWGRQVLHFTGHT